MTGNLSPWYENEGLSVENGSIPIWRSITRPRRSGATLCPRTLRANDGAPLIAFKASHPPDATHEVEHRRSRSERHAFQAVAIDALEDAVVLAGSARGLLRPVRRPKTQSLTKVGTRLIRMGPIAL